MTCPITLARLVGLCLLAVLTGTTLAEETPSDEERAAAPPDLAWFAEELQHIQTVLTQLEGQNRQLRQSVAQLQSKLEKSWTTAPASEGVAPEEPMLEIEPIETEAIDAGAGLIIEDGLTVAESSEPELDSDDPTARYSVSSAATLFEDARRVLSEMNFYEAEKKLQRLLEKFPDYERADQAQYWLGEVRYNQGRFRDAVEAFKKLEDYPTSEHQRIARLKRGYSHYELKEYKKARVLLEALRLEAPDSNIARLAQFRLERIERELISE